MVNEKGIFHIFAIDHRDVFVKCLEDNVGHDVTPEEITEEKNRLMEAVSEVTGGYLIDPVYFVKRTSRCQIIRTSVYDGSRK